MEKGGGKILFFVFLFILGIFLNLFFVDQVFCYDTYIAHPGIAGLAVKSYNKDNTKKITAEQYNWIKQGAIEEDTPTRWLNHFYDPVYNRGLWFITQHESSKVWAKDPLEQKSYSQGDNTWQRAVNDYRRGDYQSAFIELGHNIHLVSDLLVPAHTRADIHAPKPDSYEEYVKNNWDSLSKNINPKPIYKPNLENIFDEAANFSNNNFYSDDTIEDKNYKINSVDNILELKSNNDKMFIVQSKVGKELIDLYAMDGSDWKKSNHKILNESVVLSDYAQHLLPKVVAYSAGTIKLFLDETQKNQAVKLPLLKSNLSGLVNSISAKLINVAENIYNNNTTKADTNSSFLNQATNKVVDQIESVGNTINKKILITSSTVATSSLSGDFSSPAMRVAVPTISTSSTIIENSRSSSSSTPVFSRTNNGGSSGSIFLVQPVVSNNNFLSATSSNTSTTLQSIISSPTSIIENIILISTTSITNPELASASTSISSTSTGSEILGVSTASTTINTSTFLEIFSTSTTSTVITTSTFDSNVTTSSPTTTISTSTLPVSVVTTSQLSPYLTPDVIINEVAWAGTSQLTPEDEYIELYNNSDKEINLFPATDTQKWWKLKISGQEVIINKINNPIIPPHGYYLFENPDDRTVNEISGDLIYTGTLSDSGENLQLFDSNNNLVDEVNSTNGWFAGSNATYSSMEKIDSTLSGNTSTNWQSNQGPRLTGKVDGGGDVLPLNGSPKQSNFGSIVLRGTQTETERTLNKSDFPYILTYYEIPVGKILNIKDSTVIKAYYPDSKIDIKGTLNINGSAGKNVSITSDNQFPKSWQGLMFYPGSAGSLTGLEMKYAGANFKTPNANMWDPKFSRAIYADNSKLNISDSSFLDDGDTPVYGTNSNLFVSDTVFKNGITAIDHYGGELSLENIEVNNFSNSNGAIHVKDIWPQLSGVSFSSSTNGAVDIASATITSSVFIGSNILINLENVTIESSGSLTVDKGVVFHLPEFSNVFIKGTLNLSGTNNEPIKFIGPTGINQYWGHLVFDGGIGNLNSVNFSGGGYNYPGDSYHGVISANNNSQITLENCQLIDNRLPVEIIQVNNSNVNFNNSSIGYTTKNTFFQNVKGIQVNSGSLSVNNSFFYNLTTGITAGSVNPLPQLNLTNMGIGNFFNVDSYWDPFNWFPFFSTSP